MPAGGGGGFLINIRRIGQLIFGVRENDPVYNCPVHIEEGCAHVDGMLCDMKTCEILKKKKEDACLAKNVDQRVEDLSR